MKRILISSINFYQRTLSPDHSPRKALYPYGYCRHYPSCSEYSKLAITKHGSIKGVGISILRIVKCNPLSKPKVDYKYIEEFK